MIVNHKPISITRRYFSGNKIFVSQMVTSTASPSAHVLRHFTHRINPAKSSSRDVYRLFSSSTTKSAMKVFAMAPKKKVNKLDEGWKKTWFGQGIFYEGSEDVDVDVFKKIEKRKVLSKVEKAGLLSKAEQLGFTLSSIEKLGVFSKAEQLGLLSLLEKVAGVSPAALASLSLPVLVAAILAFILIPDDSAALVVVQALVGGGLAAGAVGLYIGSVVLDGLQEAD